MKCPHCLISIHPSFGNTPIGEAPIGESNKNPVSWSVDWMVCPSCGKAILNLRGRIGRPGIANIFYTIYPKNPFQNEKSGRFNVRQQMRQQAMERNAS